MEQLGCFRLPLLPSHDADFDRSAAVMIGQLCKIIAALICCALSAVPASAAMHGSAGSVGKAQLNLGAGDQTAQTFINLFHSSTMLFSAPSQQAALDADGFPVNNFSGVIGGIAGNYYGAPTRVLSTTGPWTLGWEAGRSCFRLNFNETVTFTNLTNATSPNTSVIQGDCAHAGSVTVTFADASIFQFQLDGVNYSHWNSNATGKFYLIRASDQIAYNNGIFWTPEAVSLIKNLHPESIRPMGWNVVNGSGTGGNGADTGTNVVNWGYRKQTTAFSFVDGSSFPPGMRCGGATSFCTITVSNGDLTAAAAADTNLSGWTDGEQIGGNVASQVGGLSITGMSAPGGNCTFTVSSTAGMTAGQPVLIQLAGGATECNGRTTIQSVIDSTHFSTPASQTNAYTSGGIVGYQTLSITGKSGGAKLITNCVGGAVGVLYGDVITAGSGTFTYNSVLDSVLYCWHGISNAVPLEAQVQLANLVNANFWYNIPTWASNDFVTNTANTIYSNLNTNLKLIVEWANEIFNNVQGQTFYAAQMGTALGLTTINAFDYSGFQSLRVRQINGNLLPASSWSAAMSRLERLYCFQGGYPSTQFNADPMSGIALISPGTTAYQNYVGGSSVDYNTYPNRPIDFTESICYAPYITGGTAFSGQSSDSGVGFAPTIYDASTLNTAISDWNGGNEAGAIALVDQSVRGDLMTRVQTVSATGTTFTTPAAHNFSVNDAVRFTVSGGTQYSNISLVTPYIVLSTPTSKTFTVGQYTNGITSLAVNAGSAGSGTMSVGDLGATVGGYNVNSQSIFTMAGMEFQQYQYRVTNNFSPAPVTGSPEIRMYEGALMVTGPSATQAGSIGVVANSQTITSLSSNSVCTGSMPYVANEQIAFTNAGSITGISANTNYYAINISGNCMGISTSSGGGALTLGGFAGGAAVGSTTAAASILASVVTAWKNDPSAAATMKLYYQAFKGQAPNLATTGIMANASAPSQLVLSGGGIYGLVSNSSVVSPAPYELYYGFQSFSGQ
jgi:hypothetical protein